MTTLSKQLKEYIRACFTGIWIQSHEHQDALLEMAQLCQQENWSLATWDIDQGLRTNSSQPLETPATDPLSAIRSLGSPSDENSVTLLVLANFHRFMNSAEVVQALHQQIHQGKHQQTFIVVLAPVVEIPVELEKLFVCVEHELPSSEQLEEIAAGIATEEGEMPEGIELQQVLEAASGLTRYEAEGAFSLSLVRHGRIESSAIWQLKSQALTKSGLLSLHQGDESFQQLGGLESLKSFCLRALRTKAGRPKHQKARGVLLLGVSGSGKSAFAKSLGNETGRPTITLDVGALMGSLVGQSEERTRRALKIVDAMQPAILFIDEVEKALGGVGSQSDSGVSSRMFGTMLSWLNDHQSDVFVVCTANDVSKLPPEFSRSERFDGLFFLDLPNQDQRETIWQMYLEYFQLPTDQQLPENKKWTGAEIKSCCRLSALLDLPLLQAAQNIVPVATTASESVELLRTWASGRCLSAEEAGIYQHQACQQKTNGSKTRRQINRDPSNN